MISVVQYLLILKSSLLFHNSFFIQKSHSHRRSVRSPECSYSSLQMKSIIYSRLYLKGSKVCKKLKMRDMRSTSASAHRGKFISVELTVDLRAIYTVPDFGVFVCVCQEMHSCVCTPEHIYLKVFGCSCMIAPVLPHWLALKQCAIRGENFLIRCPLTGAKACVHPHSEVY